MPTETPPQAPVADWGKDTTAAQLSGYVASGAFDKDIAAFFGATDPATDFDADAGRATDAFSRLPEQHRASATTFDRIVRGRSFPTLRTTSISGYGFDCVKNDLHNAADAKYFGLGYNGFGDLYLLNLETGEVPVWAHDRDPFEDGEVFPSLDAYAFAILRIELATTKRAPAAEVAETFKRLGFAWASPS